MSWQKIRGLFEGLVGALRRGSTPQPQAVALTVNNGPISMDLVSARPMPIASLGATPREADGRVTMSGAIAVAAEFLGTRFSNVTLDQVAAFPLREDGTLAETMESAWHLGFWCERNGADWPRALRVGAAGAGRRSGPQGV